MGKRYICVHGHFYQPPRENPWLESVERQDSAWPFHDWNERVHAECYATNASARILDAAGNIERIVNNYEKISFNFGPTLLSWMASQAPDVHAAIVQADRAVAARTGGHGAALAQVYGHLILPLANERDKRTQVLWGRRDFEVRFGRAPRGMWLSETACDSATLEVLVDAGIEFTVLAPRQCRAVRAPGAAAFAAVGGAVDPRRAYRVQLPSGRSICVFFYDGPLSQAIAFERLLDDGGRFARRLLGALDDRAEAQLVHVATDGETYGHHHRYGEMALAYALGAIEALPGVELTTYEAFLAAHPPTWEAQIEEATSWSCAHGVERWRSDCGCSTGGGPGYRQHWREPLRNALDWLRDQLIPLYEAEAGKLLADPWRARDRYVDVVLDRSEQRVARFFEEEQAGPLSEGQRSRALELLEMQRHAMLMYTSCGWFFSDLGGLETIQIISYAARALQLAGRFVGDRFEDGFLSRLSLASSNDPEVGDGEELYEEHVRPARVDLKQVGAHFAVSALFENYRERESRLGYDVAFAERENLRAGNARLIVGRMQVRSRITGVSEDLAFAVCHLGDHNLTGGVRSYEGAGVHAAMREELVSAFSRAEVTEVLRALERHFPSATYSLRSLFKDEQRKVLGDILEATLETVAQSYARIYAHHAPLMRYLASLSQPVPRALHQAAEYTLAARVQSELARGRDLDLDALHATAQEARVAGVALAGTELSLAAQGTLGALLQELAAQPADEALLAHVAAFAAFLQSSDLELDLRAAQNALYAMREQLSRSAEARPSLLTLGAALGMTLVL